MLFAVSGCTDKDEAGSSSENIMFTFEVTDDNGETTSQVITTDETMVGAALLKQGLISGETSDFGLYITAVNGVTADYNADKAYWAFYIDGEYAMMGADTTAIEKDKVYAFVYTKE